MEILESVEERFYKKCAELLSVDHIYKQPFSKKTRWNNREPGNGRYPKYGLIRRFNTELIHVILIYPIKINQFFNSEEKVLEFLKSLSSKIE